MNPVRPKKHLGQHFLKDQNIAGKIVGSLEVSNPEAMVIEVGPGTGVLTEFLLPRYDHFLAVDPDFASIAYLNETYSQQAKKFIVGDFLKLPLDKLGYDEVAVIGNFPYNISSQIFFKVLDHRAIVDEVVGMIQKEVADRICSPPGNKQYGILSVLLQAFYRVDYLFTVEPHVFLPPPKVRSAVIRLTRLPKKRLECDETLFFRVVKAGFQKRRKTLRNALKQINLPPTLNEEELLNARAEQLSVADFEGLTLKLEQEWKKS